MCDRPFDIAAVLIQAGAKINARADDGSGPLLDVVGHITLNESTRKTRRDFAQFLIARGAQVNTADWFGTTPLIRAATTGDEQLAQLLLYRGAEVDAVAINGDSACSGPLN